MTGFLIKLISNQGCQLALLKVKVKQPNLTFLKLIISFGHFLMLKQIFIFKSLFRKKYEQNLQYLMKF